MIKAAAKIVLSIVCALVLLAIAVTAIIHFTNEKRHTKEWYGPDAVPTKFY